MLKTTHSPVDLKLIKAALSEDGARHDATTFSLVPADAMAEARFIVKADGIMCGMDVCAATFSLLDKRCRLTPKTSDGKRVRKGQVIAIIKGPARALLTGERTALNLLQHLSGIATLTARYVEKVRGTKAGIFDTRKTIPGLRDLAKYAVRCGGGKNHRQNLSDMVLIKDNHLVYIKDLAKAVQKVRTQYPSLQIEVECESLEQVTDALNSGADMIMLDNMTTVMLKKALSLIHNFPLTNRKKRPQTEISGGVNLKTVAAFARLGVDRISVGALTHSVAALDISLEFN